MAPSTTPKLIIIDDDRRMLNAMARLLAGWGVRFESYDSARAALAAIGREPPALLLVDIFMPELDGFEVITRVRRLSPETRIIAISGDVICGEPTNVLTMSRYLGADATIQKPIRPERLRALLEEALPALRGGVASAGSAAEFPAPESIPEAEQV